MDRIRRPLGAPPDPPSHPKTDRVPCTEPDPLESRLYKQSPSLNYLKSRLCANSGGEGYITKSPPVQRREINQLRIKDPHSSGRSSLGRCPTPRSVACSPAPRCSISFAPVDAGTMGSSSPQITNAGTSVLCSRSAFPSFSISLFQVFSRRRRYAIVP